MKRQLLLLTIAISILLALGCSSATNTVFKADPDAVPDVQEHNKIVKNKSLDKHVYVDNVYVTDSDGLLSIQVNIRNKKKSDFNIMYRFDWFDKQGMEVYDPANPWTRTTIYGGQFVSLRAVATSPEVVDWRLSLKETDD